MKKVQLIRIESGDEGTFGYLLCDGKFWVTLELPDRDNKSNISRIPKGTYEVKIRYSPSFRKKLYCLQNVRNRTYILIHGANFAGDTSKGYQTHLHGCIALGKKKGKARNKFKQLQKCIFNSQQAMREFMDTLNNKEFMLDIKEIK